MEPILRFVSAEAPMQKSAPRLARARRDPERGRQRTPRWMGARAGYLAFLPFLGPAFIASVAYIDPGNFATNIQGGSVFGYNLLWVIAAGESDGDACFKRCRRSWAWPRAESGRRCAPSSCRAGACMACGSVSELAAMATDLAEFLGASIGFNLLFDIPLLARHSSTGVVDVSDA